MKNEAFISVVVCIDHRIETLKSDLLRLQEELEAKYTDFEILIVVQGPARLYLNENQISEILDTTCGVRLLQLSYNVGTDVLKSAGVENAMGDLIIIVDLSRDPLEIISQSIELCLSGHDVIVGISRTAPSPIYRVMRKMMSGLLHLFDYHLPPNDTGFRCISRRAVNAVISTGHFYHQLGLRLQKTGYLSATLPYTPKGKWIENKSTWGAFRYFLRVLVFSSTRPLRWMSALGILGSGLGFLFAIYSVALHFFGGGVVEGWTTTVMFMSMQFILLFVILAFISEYMGRLLEEQRGGSDYAIVFERNSNIMIVGDRVNVMQDSTTREVNHVQTARNA